MALYASGNRIRGCGRVLVVDSGQRSALVVGVGAVDGLGAAYARRFARAGFSVVAAGRNRTKLDRTVEAVARNGLELTPCYGDAANEADAIRFAKAAEALAPLGIAVHNAGGSRRASVLDLPVEDLHRHWSEHTLGGFLTGREAARLMVERGSGVLLFTGATASLRGRANFAAFASAKAALRILVQSFARELGPRGIHVAHLIVDGQISSNGGDDSGGVLSPAAIAEAAYALATQPRSAWTQELDLRPFDETW